MFGPLNVKYVRFFARKISQGVSYDCDMKTATLTANGTYELVCATGMKLT